MKSHGQECGYFRGEVGRAVFPRKPGLSGRVGRGSRAQQEKEPLQTQTWLNEWEADGGGGRRSKKSKDRPA